MTLQKKIQILGAVVLALMLATISTLFFLYTNQQSLNSAQQNRYESHVLANELRMSSENLTRLARTFVVTGDAQYEREYWSILNVRNGKAPRPDGRQVALQELMRQLGFTSEEFAKLKEAESLSNDLVNTETVAMTAVKNGATSGEEYNHAVRIMHDQKYHDNKAKIMQPIDAFEALLNDRTLKDVKVHIQKAQFLLGLIAFFAILTTIMAFVTYSQISYAITRLLGADPAKLSAILQRIAKGDLVIAFDEGPIHGVYSDLKTVTTSLEQTATQAENIANGNLQNEIVVLSEQDRLGKAFAKMSKVLNEVIFSANRASEFVLSGSQQVSSASQTLSNGATEQAAAVEEISSSVTEISSKIRSNADSCSRSRR